MTDRTATSNAKIPTIPRTLSISVISFLHGTSFSPTKKDTKHAYRTSIFNSSFPKRPDKKRAKNAIDSGNFENVRPRLALTIRPPSVIFNGNKLRPFEIIPIYAAKTQGWTLINESGSVARKISWPKNC